MERSYQDWKWAVNELWEHERHHLQTAAHQCLLDKHAAHERQEAARHQRLFDKETARCQCLLDKETTCRLKVKCAALAQQMAAAQTIFLWLRRRHLHVQLVHLTSGQQQRKAALVYLRYEQDCCLRAVLMEEQCQQAAAARGKAWANKADKQRRQDALAAEKCCQESAEHAAATAESALAKEQRCRESAERAVLTTEWALAKEQCHKESAEHAAAMAELALAKEQ